MNLPSDQTNAVIIAVVCIVTIAVALIRDAMARTPDDDPPTVTDHQAAFTAHTNQALAIVREANLTAGPTPAPGVAGHSLADVVPIRGRKS